MNKHHLDYTNENTISYEKPLTRNLM